MRLRESVRASIEEIRDDREHGARELALQALDVLLDLAETSRSSEADDLADEVERAISELESVRSSMAPIANAVRRIRFDTRRLLEASSEISEFRKKMLGRIEEEKRSITRSTEKIVDLTKPLLRDKRIMTHSYSSTVLEALLAAREDIDSVIATESRPLLEGRNLAKRLAKAAIPVTLITDASAGYFISDVDMVLVGADSILPDGSIVNKMGTFLIASAAQKRDVRFYVATDTYKWSETVELQEGPKDEILSESPSSIDVRNVYFDVTPPHLISYVVTELGLFTPSDFVSKMKKSLEQW